MKTARHLQGPRTAHLFLFLPASQPVDASTGSKSLNFFSASGERTERSKAESDEKKEGQGCRRAKQEEKKSPRCIRKKARREGRCAHQRNEYLPSLVVLLMHKKTRPKPLLRPLLGHRSKSDRKQGKERRVSPPGRRGLANIDGLCERREMPTTTTTTLVQRRSLSLSRLEPHAALSLPPFVTRRDQQERERETRHRQGKKYTLTSTTRRKRRGQSCRAPSKSGRASWPQGGSARAARPFRR